ncbi:MAG: hypothetical protein OEY28_13040, partial [Nitrospira sp.]|nr:hypothetical protein [Nitrospira sp.]
AAAPAAAFEQGDFGTRGSIAYVRIKDLSSALSKLGGADWMTPLERIARTMRGREAREIIPVFEELKRVYPHVGQVEYALIDIMAESPNVQLVEAAVLKPGAPEGFSEEFLEFIKDRVGNEEGSVVEADHLQVGAINIRFLDGMVLTTIGGSAAAHVEDVLKGDAEECLNKLEAFSSWNRRAKGDIVAWVNLAILRSTIEKLGSQIDREAALMLDLAEWQKWSTATLNVELPGERSHGITAELDLQFSEPMSSLAAFTKPAGSSKLYRSLPAGTLGFVSAQLGRDHERTLMDILKFFHEFDYQQRKAWRERNLSYMENEVEMYTRMVADLKEQLSKLDKNSENYEAEKQRIESNIKDYEKELEEVKGRIERTKEEIISLRERPFEPDREARAAQELVPSEAEQFLDTVDKALTYIATDREEVLASIGEEVVLGFVGLPDPQPDDDDPDIFEEMWFVMVHTTDRFPALKEKILDVILARKLPEDISDEEREAIKKGAERLELEKVDGGELLHLNPGEPLICFGDSFVALAPNREVAKRILDASFGKARFDLGRVPGGDINGSKFAYLDLCETIARMMDGDNVRSFERLAPREFLFDLREIFEDGARVSPSSDESATSLRFTLRTAGEKNFRDLLNGAADTVEFSRSRRHDREVIESVASALGAWRSREGENLASLGERELKEALAKVNFDSLLESKDLKPFDGLRSAFDPALRLRLEAMLAARGDVIGDGRPDGEEPP